MGGGGARVCFGEGGGRGPDSLSLGTNCKTIAPSPPFFCYIRQPQVNNLQPTLFIFFKLVNGQAVLLVFTNGPAC